MTLDATIVQTRCAEITDSLAKLDRFTRLDRRAFVEDEDAIDLASHRLLVAMEAALALCYHVSSRQLKKLPENYAACFMLLGDHGIIPPELSERLREMARFRNVLVHMYGKVDPARVHDILQHNLDDLRSFARAMAALVA